MEGVAPNAEPPELRGVSTEQAITLAVDALFLFVGAVYGSRVLAPKPMTYLSEIAFPMDASFCGKLAASLTLFLLNGLRWLYHEIFCSWLMYHRPFGRDQQNVVAMMETLVWGTSASILWMEYRRGLTPSLYLRLFWLVKWLDATFFLAVNQQFAATSNLNADGAPYKTSIIFGGVCYAASAILMLFLCVKPTLVTPEFIAFPTEVNTPSAYLNSSHHQPPTSLYGSFKDWELVAYPSSSTNPAEERANLDVTIPATTSSIWGNKQFVAFKILVQTDEDHWTLRRPYSDFAALHEELPEEVRADCILPAENHDDRRLISWKDRPRSLKSRLESYLKKVLHHPKLAPYTSQALCEFLEVEYVEDIASVRSFHSHELMN